MEAIIDIDAQLLQEVERLARAKGEPLSRIVERALRESLRGAEQPTSSVEAYGEPLTDEDIADAARVSFGSLDAEERRAQTR